MKDNLNVSQIELNELFMAFGALLNAVIEYRDYKHDGDPNTEDARAMGEMTLDDMGCDGRLEKYQRMAERFKAINEAEGDEIVKPYFLSIEVYGAGINANMSGCVEITNIISGESIFEASKKLVKLNIPDAELSTIKIKIIAFNNIN